MTDPETRLAQARERLSCADYREGCECTDCVLRHQGFDTAAAVAREVVAAKDKRIQALESRKVNPNLRKKLAEGSIDIVDDREIWGFDAASKIALEVIEESYPDGTYQEVCAELYIRGVALAEKDAEIARLKSENAALVAQGGAASDATTSIPEPRKVSDAQREALEKFFLDELGWEDQHKPLFMGAMITIIESPADAEATT